MRGVVGQVRFTVTLADSLSILAKWNCSARMWMWCSADTDHANGCGRINTLRVFGLGLVFLRGI